MPRKKRKKQPKRLQLNIWSVIRYALILVSVLIIYAYIEPHLLMVKRVEIVDEDIPQAFVGKKIAFLTDIHYGPYFTDKEVERLVKKTNQLEPDIIILGGDYTDPNLHLVSPVFEKLKNLKAKYGIYAVLGNHDYWKEGNFTTHAIKDAGITLLDNKSEWVEIDGERIKIGGIEDMWYGEPNYRATVQDVKREDFVILVSHNPDFAEKIISKKVDLMLGGHHHGGQGTIFGLYAPVIYSKYGQKYRYGWVEKDDMKIFVSKGIGTIGTPIRFFAMPEIVVVELKK